MKKAIMTIVLILTLQQLSFSHPGHGFLESNLVHYLTSPAHLGLFVLVLGIGYWGVRKLKLVFQKNK